MLAVLQGTGNLVLRAEMIIQSEAQQMVFVADARGVEEARAIVESLRVQGLAKEEIFRPRRPLIGEGVFETGADNIFHPRGLRPGRREDGVGSARPKRQRRRAARAAGGDAAGEINERAAIGVTDAAANAREEIRARIGGERIKRKPRRIGRRGGEEAVGAPASVKKAEVRLETPDPGTLLPIIADLRADGDAGARDARGI